MKEIIYNEDKINEEDVNKWVKRAKIIVENSNKELLLVKTDDSCYLLGGHVDGDESDNECLIREIKEEAGIDFNPNVDSPLVRIKYFCKDYPETGINTGYISNYYVINSNLEPNSSNVSLTEEEKVGNLQLVYVSRDDVINFMEYYLKLCKKIGVVRDTIDVIKFYLDVKE